MFGWATATNKSARLRAVCDVNLKVLDEFAKNLMRMDMDREHEIDSFLELAMCDPFSPEKSLVEAKGYVDKIRFEVDVYDEELLVEDKLPKTVFVPSRKLFRKIYKAMLLYGSTESNNDFFLRFGLLDNCYVILQQERLKLLS
jgi:hypothetical protein